MSSDPNQQQLPQLTQPPVYAESQQISQYQQNPQHQQNTGYCWDVFDLMACVCSTFAAVLQ